MLLNPLDFILGTATKVKLVRALVPLERPVSGREAARLAGVSRIAQRSLDELAQAGVLTRGETAGQYLYAFHREHVLAHSLIALFDEEDRYTRAVFERLGETLKERQRDVVSAVIYGSASRGEADPSSDLDVLVLVRSDEAKAPVYDALVEASPRLETDFGLRLSPVVLTLEQARAQRAEEDPFTAEVLRDARRICGRPLEEVMDG